MSLFEYPMEELESLWDEERPLSPLPAKSEQFADCSLTELLPGPLLAKSLDDVDLLSFLDLEQGLPASPLTDAATSPEPEPPAPIPAHVPRAREESPAAGEPSEEAEELPAAPADSAGRPRRSKRKSRFADDYDESPAADEEPQPRGRPARRAAAAAAAAASSPPAGPRANRDPAIPPGMTIMDIDPATVAAQQAPHDKAEQRRIRNRLSAAQHRERQRTLVHDLKETLKARDAEIAALKRRVAELQRGNSDAPTRKRGRTLAAVLFGSFLFVGMPLAAVEPLAPVEAEPMPAPTLQPVAITAASRKLFSLDSDSAEEADWRMEDSVLLFPPSASAAAERKPPSSVIQCASAQGSIAGDDSVMRLFVPAATITWNESSSTDDWLEIDFRADNVRHVVEPQLV